MQFVLILVVSLAGLAMSNLAKSGEVQVPAAPIISVSKPGENLSREMRYALLLGRWYGVQPTTEGGLRQTLIERRDDGSYVIHFRIKSASGEIKDQWEMGEWGVSGDIIFTICKGWLKNGKFVPADYDPYNYDAYRITKLTAAEFEYTNAETRNHFVSKKVANDFKLPDL